MNALAEYTISDAGVERNLELAEKALTVGKWDKACAYALVALVHDLQRQKADEEIKADRL